MLTVLTGRSRRLWPRVLAEIGQAFAGGADRLFLITPDQYTLQAELELVEKLNLPGLMQVEVLSPSRLLSRVFTLAGSPQRVRIDARGKAMMLADVIRRSKDDLVYYGGAAERQGFAERLSSDIANLKAAGKGPREVAEGALTLPEASALRDKLLDMALLYARYEERLEGAFLDGEDAQQALLERLPQSGLLQGACVWIYGFDLIAPPLMRQIAVMAREALSVRLALTWEKEGARDGLVFAPSRETLARLARYLDAERLQWEKEHIEEALPVAPEIRWLESELFAMPPLTYEGEPQAVHLSLAADPYDEAMCVAAKMLDFARDGMPFDEMAIVLCDTEGYAGAVETAAGRSGIPYHLARKRPAIGHPLIRAWLAALRCATQRWRLEDALDWLKGGFSGLAVEEAERLENYAVENGLRGAKWKRAIDDEALESIRERFAAPLVALQARLGRARGIEGALAAAYGLLEDVDAYGTLQTWQSTLTERGMLGEAAECAQAWKILLETLDQLHALLEGDRIAMAALAQVIESGFAAAELDTVPASPGMVQVGRLGHVKIGGECRVLFLLGMQEGLFRADSVSLMSERESRMLSDAVGLESGLGLGGDALAALVQINLLDTLAAPSEHLFISYAATGADGEAKRPSTVLTLLRHVFTGLREEGSALSQACVWHAAGAALDAMGGVLRRAAAREGRLGETERAAIAWLLHAPQTRTQALRVLRQIEMPPPMERISHRISQGLYAHTRTSVSRLETFANCPFRHFVSYGLRPVPRRDFVVARDETGTFYHRAMEGYSQLAAQTPQWPEISKSDSDALMDAVLEPLRAQWENTPLGDNAMLRATGDAFCRVARRTAWTYAGQMRDGRFRTGVVEARFGPGEALPPIALVLPDGRRRWIEGRIDRIDFLQEEGEQWLRVVDYKSGGTELEPSRVYGGLQLQLLMYLMAALAAYPGYAPAGAFYARFDDPLVNTDSRDVAEIERKLAKALGLKGIVLSDVRVIQAMGAAQENINRDGTLKKQGGAADAEEMAALMRHAYALSAEMAAQMEGGDIARRPAQLDKWRACAWCDYQSICGFDASLQGHAPRPLEKLTQAEMMQRVKAPQDS